MTNDDENHPEQAIAATIGAAQEVQYPLDGLVELTSADPGASFAPEVVAELAAMRRDNRASFEKLRAQLKEAGCRVTELDKAIDEEDGGNIFHHGGSQADTLVGFADAAELFHDPDGNGYADLDVNGHRETWAIRSRGFRRWQSQRYFETERRAASSDALQSALNAIEAKAHFDGPERVVYVRVGAVDDKLYVDLANETWQAIEIASSGWRLINKPPVRFLRSAGMKALPIPVVGGSIDELRRFLNLKTEDDFVLVVASILACLRNRGPYPIIVVTGEQGSAKSTFTAMLRSLIDPNTTPLRTLPRSDPELAIAARNAHVLAFDNVSALSAWISDAFCRLATGGGLSARQLYSDTDEVLFYATRPVILNGIEDIVTRPDLADRAIFLTLMAIPEERRRPSAELWAAFEEARPRILGVLLDAMTVGLRRLPETHLKAMPRMADFAQWAVACESELWPSGTFLAAYYGNREHAIEEVIDADPVAAAVRVLMAARKTWRGTATELLKELGNITNEQDSRGKSWPNTAHTLSGRLRRAVSFLREIGIKIDFTIEGHNRTRVIHIRMMPPVAEPKNDSSSPSAASASSAPMPKPFAANASSSNSPRTQAADTNADP